MNCSAYRRLLSESLDGTPLTAVAKAHAASCASCAAVVSRFSALGVGLADLPRRAPSAGFDAAVLAALAPRRAASPFLKSGVLLGAALSGAGVLSLTRFLRGLADGAAWPAAAEAAGRLLSIAAQARALARALWILLPDPRFGVELAAASLLACAAVVLLYHPVIPTIQPLGARRS